MVNLQDIHSIEVRTAFPFTLNVHLLALDKDLVLIDTGMTHSDVEIISEHLQKLGKSFEDISFIINTHSHIEHCAANYEVKKRSGAKLLAPSYEADVIENYGVMAKKTLESRLIPEVKKYFGEKTPLPPFEKQFYIANYLSVKPVTIDQKLKGGDWIYVGNEKLKVIHTPGHSPGHISLYDFESKILFAGDQVMGKGAGVTFVGTELTEPIGDGNLSEYMASLKELLEMDIKTIVHSHGAIVSDGKERIQHSINFYLKLERKVLDILSQGRKTAEDITILLYPDSIETWRFYMRGETIAILEKLREEGKVFQERQVYHL